MDKNNKLILAICAVACFYFLLKHCEHAEVLDTFKESRDEILESGKREENEFKRSANEITKINITEKRFDDDFNRLQKKLSFRKNLGQFQADTSIETVSNKETLNSEEYSELTRQQDWSIQSKEKKSVSSETTNKNPSPYGITIGETTEKEIFSKYSVIKRSPWTDIDGYTAIILDEKDFYSQDLPVKGVIVIINPQETVVALQTTISGKRFSELYPILANKYDVVKIEEPFVGNKKGEYECSDVNIFLNEEHMSFDTVLAYITKETNKLLSEYIARRNEQKELRIANSL